MSPLNWSVFWDGEGSGYLLPALMYSLVLRSPTAGTLNVLVTGCTPLAGFRSVTIKLTVTDLNPASGVQPVTNTFKVPAVGDLRTNEYISAGNKYPLPSPSQNTDQFNGDMTRTVYCAG